MSRTSAAAKAGAAYFAMVFAAGFALGTVRTLVLAPRFGELVSVLLELPIMLAISWVACGWVLARFQVPPQVPARLAVGAIAFGLLMLAETLLSALAFGRSMTDYLSELGTAHGLAGLGGQVLFALMPLARRGLDKPRAPLS